ncbi:hypothetical protein DDE18_14825 [Nocardioides gansuensis]|uniref:YCII-related domain-containing protein n=1 Tax=Nocardioides gansuensis TaxID=2138300 RepID=A0A2T8F8F7_9ACTN|nr:YciI family protein [Nocardioides gansuensis]PVG81970.1 hypothetical protein DDE18_14825 [Nocardioides gansuensis]
MTKYMMSVYGPAEYDENFGYASREEMQQSMAETEAFNERLRNAGYWVFADGLEQATTAAVVDAQGEQPLVADGPYLESKEHLGGFWVIDVPSRDVAMDLAAQASKACRGKVEVRAFQTGLPE